MENVSVCFENPSAPQHSAGLDRHLGPGLTGARRGSGDSRRAPGWFDSSWELQRGLDVLEGLPDDAGLHEWLELQLAR